MEKTETTSTESVGIDPEPKRRYRRRQPKGFVKVKAVAAPATKEAVQPSRQSREVAMPDAHWLAEFVAALLSARR